MHYFLNTKKILTISSALGVASFYVFVILKFKYIRWLSRVYERVIYLRLRCGNTIFISRNFKNIQLPYKQ